MRGKCQLLTASAVSLGEEKREEEGWCWSSVGGRAGMAPKEVLLKPDAVQSAGLSKERSFT